MKNKRLKGKIISILAFISRNTPHFKGKGRIWYYIYNPEKRNKDYIEAIISYDRDLKIHIDTRSFIEWNIFLFGYYEKDTVRFIKKNLPEGGVFVDVGANIGAMTLIAAKIAEKVIAIEPVDKIRKRLIENIKLNNLRNVEVMPYAVSDHIGESSFFIMKENYYNQGVSSLHKKNEEMVEIKVPVITLDSLLSSENRIDLIKIDVEGYSKEVIQGASTIIKKFKPLVICEDDNSDKMKIITSHISSNS